MADEKTTPAPEEKRVVAKKIEPAPVKPKLHVRMTRNVEQYPAPHTADVHLDEVSNWAKHGWQRVAD